VRTSDEWCASFLPDQTFYPTRRVSVTARASDLAATLAQR
jgi:hypothetical protein